MAAQNSSFKVAQIPVGHPDVKSTFALESTAIPSISNGQILTKSLYISVDPYLRGRLRSMKAGDSMVSGAVAEVTESKHSDYKAGDVVFAYLPWSRYNAVDPAAKDLRIRKLDSKVAPVSTALGVLGMPGMTAYFGLLKTAELKPGETVVVSGAAGAVGSLVGQIAKLKGCRVVGTAGSPDKVDYITKELGFDVGLNYKEHKSVDAMRKALQEACPRGVDVYFDNTGGTVTDAVFDVLNKFARVAVCGQISMYNYVDVPMVPLFLHKLIYKSVTVRGFVVWDYEASVSEFFAEVPLWIKDGKVKYQETFVDGFENLPKAFVGLFEGSNTGKMVVKV